MFTLKKKKKKDNIMYIVSISDKHSSCLQTY